MEVYVDNPSDNIIGNGITEESLQRAIHDSGYPLQAVVAECMQNVLAEANWSFPPIIQEEWSYIDNDTGSARTIDALAQVRLRTKQNARIHPVIDLLVECKQLELPTVFFIRPHAANLGVNYPRIAGGPHDRLTIKKDSAPDRHILDLAWVLGFSKHEFNTLPTPAVSMARVHRKGSKLELSGEDTYPNIVRPLIKATDHYVSLCKPHPAGCYFSLHMVVSVAVVRGPMIGVEPTEGGNDRLTYIPWARLHRLEASNKDTSKEYGELRPIDIVHASYLDSYCRHLVAFGQLMAERMEKLTIPLIWGEGRIPKGRGHDFLLADIFTILQPTVTKKAFEQEMDDRMYRAHKESKELGSEASS